MQGRNILSEITDTFLCGMTQTLRIHPSRISCMHHLLETDAEN